LERPLKSNDCVEILCIGTELLLGNILNSNAQWIAEELSSLGLNHYRQIVIGDNLKRLKEEILTSSHRCRILITTGGLGPTPDDLTTEAIASAFNCPLEERKEIWDDIQNKMKVMNKEVSNSNKKQSFIPKGSDIIPNLSGTAPGIIWSPIENFTILSFPGVPSELKDMWSKTARSWFQKNTNSESSITSKTLKITGISESLLVDKINDLMQISNPTIAPYASLGEVKLRLTAKAKTEKEGQKMLVPIEKQLKERIGSNCYGFNHQTLASVVIGLLRKRGETVAVAESCTGGGLGAYLSTIPGASEVFSGGVIAYSNQIKQEILKVPSGILETHGAVSGAVVKAMAQGVRELCKSDWAIAVSGLAGPGGGSDSKPVGLVHIAVIGKNFCEERPEKFSQIRDRTSIQYLSVLQSLNRLRLILQARS
tara:strand:- start:138 stop:1412 length:1275 start_codon:yes stop_codon:yes gene_type:complete